MNIKVATTLPGSPSADDQLILALTVAYRHTTRPAREYHRRATITGSATPEPTPTR